MARGEKKAANVEPNPDMEEKKRLKKLAISKQMLSENPSRVNNFLSPSKTVIKHHGKDILRKSQRKNRFLFSFPGLLAPISGGKIGELKDLGTKNPILYLDFPQGQMKLFGTIVYPKNGYLTMQFSRGGKNVVCEDYFDNMIVFSDAWWIGRKDENPEEARLEFPKELNAQQEKLQCDFKGGAGAGATCVQKRSISECGVKHAEQQSPEHEQEELLSESQNDSKEFMELTPTRRSTRAAGKKFNFAEVSSGDDLVDNEAETSEEEEKTGSDILCDDTVVQSPVAEKITAAAESASKSKKSSRTKKSSLVQATISTMFKKVDKLVTPDRVSQRNTRKSTNKVESNKECGSTMSDQVGTSQGEDDIEEFSSSSKDTEASDEDWAA
ncbi:DNA-binding protein RHL1 isoform X1 [Solanum dulcamara]|uniref:DNA-binding protein RHL1 isoform X1 n=1 Tax=Solanum dulcamara TaxID=45834 RepID=UPI002486AE59|nr:DNA-binding protein RHL1 isoform X1 [Solanum dulcamara]